MRTIRFAILSVVATVLTSSACGSAGGEDEFRYWRAELSCSVVDPNSHALWSEHDVEWRARSHDGLSAYTGPPEKNSFSQALFACSFYNPGNVSELVEVVVRYSDTERIDRYVESLFESVVFDTEEEYSGLSEAPPSDEWDRIGIGEFYDAEEDLEYIGPWSRFQYVFHDANMYVHIKMVFESWSDDGRLEEESFAVAQSIANEIREDSKYGPG